MNVKFKMPQFGRNLTGKGWLKELLMTVVGTSISIVLTFGTAHYLEQRQKKSDARQTAMMVIHDMDNTIETLQTLSHKDASMAELARYLMENPDRVDSIDADTLQIMLVYLVAFDKSQQYRPDESSEKVFLSSQDSWKNIDNASFIDEVQQFYVGRHEFYDHINNSSWWKKPISEEEYITELMRSGTMMVELESILRKFLGLPSVNFYLSMSDSRQAELSDIIYKFKQMSDRCKFTMGITDEELAAYIETRERTGNNVTEHQLTGPWIRIKTVDTEVIMEFCADHTYKQTIVQREAAPIFNGRIDMKYTHGGTWELRADTLHMVLKPGSKFEMDTTRITPKPGMEQETRKYIADYKAYGKLSAKKMGVAEDRPRNYVASIDRTGKKIELMWTELDNDGNTVKNAYYLTKLEE